MKAWANLHSPLAWAGYWLGRHEVQRDQWIERAREWKLRSRRKLPGSFNEEHCKGMIQTCVKIARRNNQGLVHAVRHLKTEQLREYGI